jgi:transcriptional regulator with XRE-family HTH domain
MNNQYLAVHNKEIAKKLTILRKKKSISQEQLARKLHKPQSYISKVVGLKQICVVELCVYLNKLEIDIKEFISNLTFVKK